MRSCKDNIWLTTIDVFGPLTACSNCEKTKKECTFMWLRSQRVSQASQPQAGTAPPAKRRRTQDQATTKPPVQVVEIDHHLADPTLRDFASSTELGVTFGDFACGISTFDTIPSTMSIENNGIDNQALFTLPRNDTTAIKCDYSQESSLDMSPFSQTKRESSSTSSNGEASPKVVANTNPVSHRKRRRDVSLVASSPFGPQHLALPRNTALLATTNSTSLTEGLLRIYQSSFDNALSCWMTERTCPYSIKTNISVVDGLHHRVTKLDRSTAPYIRGRRLTMSEDRAAAKCLNLAIYAFASQWAQSSPRSRSKYPFYSNALDEPVYNFEGTDNRVSNHMEFDRETQTTAWHEARGALQRAGDIESFRVVLAHIVFALTQKPLACKDTSQADPDDLAHAQDMGECEDLMSRLNLAIDTDGPPIHLEKGLRLIHSMRSKMAMLGQSSRVGSGHPRYMKPCRSANGSLNAEDRATVDLLFWLGVMFDTLSAAMHKRPLVVSDEDSNIYPSDASQSPDGMDVEAMPVVKTDGLWDEHLFAHQKDRLNGQPTRWPTSFDEAAALLCDAAPVKVLLFRKVTRIQTLLSRNAAEEEIEKALEAALEVCDHWSNLYAPFIQDCIEYHDQLPPRIQSWYTCLTGHWHLATLLLVDLIEIVDESEVSLEEQRHRRLTNGLVVQFREANCRVLAALARCACPREDGTFSQSREFHSAVSQGSLLTEPWTAVLIRAFAKAGVVLLELNECIAYQADQRSMDIFQDADDCVKALWYLGRKSDMALSAAKVLGAALKQRRKSIQAKVTDMSTYLETELWHGFEGLERAFDEPLYADCEA